MTAESRRSGEPFASEARVLELAQSIRSILTKIDGGELTARPQVRARLEGALTVLEVLLGKRASLLDEGDVESK